MSIKKIFDRKYFAYDWSILRIDWMDSAYYIDDNSDLSKAETEKNERIYAIPIPVSRSLLSSR